MLRAITLRLIAGWMMAGSLASCAGPTHYALPQGNAGRLMQIQDAKVARAKAPVFTREALHTVVDLEKEIKLKDLQIQELTEKK